MAVYNNYVDANLVLGKITEAPFAQGSKVFSVVQSFVVAAADSASSIYRVFPAIPSDAIIISIKILNDALPGVTAAVVGLYNCLNFDGVGAVINAGAELNAGVDISAVIAAFKIFRRAENRYSEPAADANTRTCITSHTL